MITYILSSFLLLAGLLALVLQRFYSSIPVWELKRLASRDDHLARSLYRVAAFGQSLRLLLWTIAVLAFASGCVLLALPAMPAVTFAVMVGILALAFVVIPSVRLTQRAARFAAVFSPSLTWILLHTHSVLDKVGSVLNTYRHFEAHTGVYEKTDLLSLLSQQRTQPDNRLHDHDVDLAERALQFTEKKVSDILQSRKTTHVVNADDTIGPLLLDDLHQHHQHSFLVYKGDKEDIVGSLAMNDAVTAKQGGRVLDLVRNDLTFVHEDFNLAQTLQALRQTNQTVAIVVNSFEEFVGIVTLDAVLEQLLGEAHGEELSYANRAAIAGYQPQAAEVAPVEEDAQEQMQPDELLPATPETNDVEAAAKDTTSPEPTEVVE